MTIVREALAYFAVSTCALLIDVSLLFVLVHYLFWWYLAAATASFLVGLFAVYGLSVKLVFTYRRLEDTRIEFATFAGIGIIGAAINATVIFFGVTILGTHYLAAKCGAAGFTYIWNFVARRQLLFVQRYLA